MLVNRVAGEIKTRLMDLAGRAGAYHLARFLVRRVPRLLVYHRFGPHACSAELFDTQMRLLRREFNVISLADLYRVLQAGEEIPPNTVIITIDDGYSDFFRVALPILKKYELPATIYVVSDFIDGKVWLWPDILAYALKQTGYRDFQITLNGAQRRFLLDTSADRHRAWNDIADHCLTLRNRAKLEFLDNFTRDINVSIPKTPAPEYAALTWNELRTMQAIGIDVGSHTCSHPKLTMLDANELQHEIGASKARIESMLQQEVEGFCYPNGTRADVNDEVKGVVQRCGYRHATVGYHDLDITADVYELGRYGASLDMFDFKKTVYGVNRLRGL